jgi:hypothetical protein
MAAQDVRIANTTDDRRFTMVINCRGKESVKHRRLSCSEAMGRCRAFNTCVAGTPWSAKVEEDQ